jgi:hypothetical protein
MPRAAYPQTSLFARYRALAFFCATLAALSANPARAQSGLDALAGTWRGAGTMLFEDGTSEAFTCNGYYRAEPSLSVVFRCKGPETKFELRSKLLKAEGDQVSGVWEERTYNAAGSASGTASAGKLNVRFSGSLDGSLEMSFTPSSQSVSVSIDTPGTGIKGARLSFSRN